jgi:hypothetical protein
VPDLDFTLPDDTDFSPPPEKGQKRFRIEEPDPIPAYAQPITRLVKEPGVNGSSNGSEYHGPNGNTPAFLARAMPHSVEAEEYLLSCCMMDGDVTVKKAMDANVTQNTFYIPANGVIYSILCELQKAEMPIDLSVVAEMLKSRNLLDKVGGYAQLTQVSQSLPTTAQSAFFISRLKELETKRELIRVGSSIVEECFSSPDDLPTISERLRLNLDYALTLGKSKAKQPYSIWNPEQFRNFTPPQDTNFLGGGYIRRRQLTTLIGPPGVGKTRLSFWMAVCHICSRTFMGLDMLNGPVKWLFFGNENDPMRQKTDLAYFYNSLTQEEQKLVDSHLFMHVLDKPDDGIITLADPEAYAKLQASLKFIVPDVVVFDPWANMITGSESDDEEIRKSLRLLLKATALCCPDAAIIVIHHARTGKNTAIEAGNRFSGGSLGRGSKLLVATARCELALWPGHSEDSSRLVLTCEKANNVKCFEPKGLLFEHGIYIEDGDFSLDAWKDDIEGIRSAKTLTIEDLVECVKQKMFQRSDIVKHCVEEYECSVPTIARRLKEAVTRGWLVQSQPVGSYALGPKAGGKQPEPKQEPERWDQRY